MEREAEGRLNRILTGTWALGETTWTWKSPAGRVYRVWPDRGTFIASCDGIILQTLGHARCAWWRSAGSAKFACEVREAQRIAEEVRAKSVQTSAPSVVVTWTSNAVGPEEQFAFRVGQALRSKQIGALDSARRWLTDAISALDEIQKAEWAKRDAAARSSK